MQLSSSSSSSRCSHSQPLLPKTPFQCFLQKYREDCRPAVHSSDEQLVKLQAGKFWRKMSTEQKRPYVQQAKENKRVLITKHTIFILADYDYTKICLHVQCLIIIPRTSSLVAIVGPAATTTRTRKTKQAGSIWQLAAAVPVRLRPDGSATMSRAAATTSRSSRTWPTG